MSKLKKYNLAGKQLGSVDAPESILAAKANAQMVKNYVVAYRHNLRQWSACTKTKSEVAHSNQKPHKQKGTGKARQGSLASPQYKGGGVVFGPRPKFNQRMGMNRKEKQACVQFLLGEKMRAEHVFVLEDPKMDQSKTKEVLNFINALETNVRRPLFLLDSEFQTIETDLGEKQVSATSSKYNAFKKSASNLPKVEVKQALDVNAYDLLAASCVVITESGLKQMIDNAEKSQKALKEAV